jgi:exopolyphosphatase/guanosine-5'-triphosphate,3'-diphosphate pyrophosphatase
MTRVAVVDIGTNSTRLLLADVGPGVRELRRESTVTRLGDGVDATGRLDEAAQRRVLAALDRYAPALAEAGVRRAVLTSAVRDADNGPAFAAAVRERYGLAGGTLSGDEEARLTFLGATAEREGDDPRLVIDIGGGSTELVLGRGRSVVSHVSTQVGVVRHSERHLHTDPPTAAELAALADDARSTLRAAARHGASAAVAVAGTATSCAAIDLALDPYDPARVEGHRLDRARLEAIRDRLAALPLDERRAVAGLHPDRAPTIVAGVIVLLEALAAHGLEAVEVSERDILWGVALASTSGRASQE